MFGGRRRRASKGDQEGEASEANEEAASARARQTELRQREWPAGSSAMEAS